MESLNPLRTSKVGALLTKISQSLLKEFAYNYSIRKAISQYICQEHYKDKFTMIKSIKILFF